MTHSVCPISHGLPTGRPNPFDPPAIFKQLQSDQPVSPMVFPDGHQGWLVNGYHLVRSILTDPRFTSDGAQKHLAFASERAADFEEAINLPGMFEHMDPPEHTRFRKLLTGQFTVRRMRALTEMVEGIATGLVEGMARKGAPSDLVADFAMPMSSQVISELLGVPLAERDRFEHDSDELLRLDIGPEEASVAFKDIVALLTDLIRHRKTSPGEDLLSGLVQRDALTEAELLGVSLFLLVAGYETTASMLALGTYTLLQHPDQLALLRADSSLLEGTVEELLRYLTIVHIGVQRTPKEDVEIGGVKLKKGETALLHLPSANRDPERFEDPDVFDVTRKGTGHLTFSHGVHQCLGQQLARVELRIGFATLLGRFPRLRLAEQTADIPMRDNMTVYGVRRLPVAW